MENQYHALVTYFGGQHQTSEKLKVSQPTVSGWLSGKHGMSAVTALKAEKVSNGHFKASELCPRLSEI